MTLLRAPTPTRATALALLVLAIAALAIVLGTGPAEAQQISTDTTYKDESLVLTEDLVVVGGAKLSFRGCDITFRPPGTAPLCIRVDSGALEIYDTDMVGEGAGFIVSSHGNSVVQNVTATGLGAVSNSSLRARGLPMVAHGGFMFFGSKVTVFNLDVSGAPATAFYAEDCQVDAYTMTVRDACTRYTGSDQCAAVAIVYLGSPGSGAKVLSAELNSTKVITSANHGLLVAAGSTSLGAKVTLKGSEISTSFGSGLVVYEVNSHGHLSVVGDTNEIHHSKGNAIAWVRSSAQDTSELLLETTRMYSNEGSALSVVATSSRGVADLTLKDCTIEGTVGHGAIITATGCAQTLNVTLRGCKVDGSGGSGLYFTTDGDAKTSQYHLRLLDTTLSDSKGYGVYSKLSQCYCQYNLTLDGASVVGSGSDGIYQEYSLSYFSYTDAPIVTANVTVRDSRISDNGGHGIRDVRYLKTYYAWATGRSTLHAAINVLDSTIANHTKTAVTVSPTSQFQYCTYTTEAFIDGSAFTNNSGHGYYERVDSLSQANGGSTHMGWHVSGSTFSDLTHSGVYIELRRADNAMVLWDVRDCTFSDLGQHGAVLTATSSTYVGNVMTSLVGSTFTDLKDRAYHLWPGRPGTGGDDARVLLEDVRAHNTTGIYVSLDGYSAEDSYEISVRRVNVSRTRGNAIDILVHPYQAARAVTELRDIYTRDTNGTALSLSYTSDRKSKLWGELSGDNITLLEQVAGLAIYEHTGVLTNLTVRGSTDFDLHKVDNLLPPDETGILELHSAAMDRRKAKVVGAGSLWVFNELRVRVEWQNGLAALGAGVQIQDRTFEVVSVGHVDSEDGMDPVELLAYIMDSTEFRSRSPFIVNITFLDLEQTGVCSLDEPAVVRIVVHDRVAPSMVVLEPDDGAAQRASYFELRGSAFDAHAGLLEIRYRLDGGNWTVVGSTSPFRTTVEGVDPGDHLLEVEVEDRAGNVANEPIHIEIDNQPPHLVVASPEGDVLTRDPQLVVRGETEAGASVSINGEEVETLHGLFIAEVHLEEGPNTITVVSMDRLSNVATVRFTAVLDTVEPFVDVSSHEDGDWVSSTSQVLAGIVEVGCTLTIDGQPVEVSNGSFEALVELQPGDNAVTFKAIDPAGNVYTEVISIHVAGDMPWIHLEAPLEGALYSAREVRVVGTVQPGSIVSVNGRRVTIKKGLVDELLILPEGMSTVTVDAEDQAGNVMRVTRTVIVDTVAPVLTLDPPPDSTREAIIALSGTAEGATSLWLNGALVPLGANGTFRFNVTLYEGANELRLLARDGAGHEDQATARVMLDTTPPFIKLLLPPMEEDGQGILLSDRRTISLQVVSEPGASITLNDVYVIVDDEGTATVELDLPGSGDPLDIRVFAVDELGNSRELFHRVAYQGGGAEDGSSIDLVSLLPTLLNLALLVAIVVIIARYRAMVRRATRRRRGPRPPNGRRPNGRPDGGPDGGPNIDMAGGPNGGVRP